MTHCFEPKSLCRCGFLLVMADSLFAIHTFAVKTLCREWEEGTVDGTELKTELEGKREKKHVKGNGKGTENRTKRRMGETERGTGTGKGNGTERKGKERRRNRETEQEEVTREGEERTPSVKRVVLRTAGII